MTMPDSNIYDDLKFSKELEAQGDDPIKLAKFLAWNQYRFQKNIISVCKNLEVRISILENTVIQPLNGNKKTAGIVGGVVGSIVAGLIVIIEYFTNR